MEENGTALPKGRILTRELKRTQDKAKIGEIHWTLTVGSEAKIELLAACRSQEDHVKVHAVDGKLSFEGSVWAYRRDDLAWVLRKDWLAFKVWNEGVIGVTVAGLAGDYTVYLRAIETEWSKRRSYMLAEANRMARIAEAIDFCDLKPVHDPVDDYWDNPSPEPDPPKPPQRATRRASRRN